MIEESDSDEEGQLTYEFEKARQKDLGKENEKVVSLV